ncbi:MAG: hypothetical protein IJR29_09765 [Butyrivibrio sp.]|nr:hypothetical protein [Butyrivibrio sp.]
MKNKLFSSKLIRRVLSIVLVAGLLVAAFSRNFVSEAIFDPDRAINYQQFAASTNVDNSVLFIGTYIVHKDALNDQIYDKAKNSASESGQSDIYYKSEISDGQWFNIGDIENGVKGISTQGKPENIETINPLYVTYYVGADGIMKDAKTLASVNPFDVPDPYDLSTLEELSPIRNQYTMSQSATSISQEDFLSGKGSKDNGHLRSDVYYYQILSTFFSLNLRDSQTDWCDQKLQSLNNSYIALKAAGQEDEAKLVYDLMEKIDASRRALIFERLSELDENLLNTLETLASGSYYTTSGNFKDSSAQSNASSQPKYVVELEDSLKHNFTGTNSASSFILSFLNKLGISSGGSGWWSVLGEADSEKRKKSEEANKDNDDYWYDETPEDSSFTPDSSILEAIGDSMSKCGDSYTTYVSKALVDSNEILDHVIYDYSNQVIEQTSGTTVGGPVTYLKYATNIKDNVINDKEGELQLLKSSLIDLAGSKYYSSATNGVNSDYAVLTSEGAKSSSLEEQKTDQETDRSTLQFLIDALRQRDTAQNALEYVYERISWSEGLLSNIPEDDYQKYSTSSVQAHIVWLKEEAQKIIDSDESLKSKLDELQEKKEQLQEKRDSALDNNDLAGAAAYDAKIAAVDNDINAELANLSAKNNSGTSSGSGQGTGSETGDSTGNNTGTGTGSGSGSGTGSGTGTGSGNGSGSGSGTGTGSGTGSGSGSGTGSDSGSSSGSGSGTGTGDNGSGAGTGDALASLKDNLVDKALAKLADNADADLSGIADALAGLGAEEELDALLKKAEASGASANALAGVKDAKDSLKENKSNVDSDALLAQLEALFGKSIDDMNEDELAIAGATASRLSQMGITPAQDLVKNIVNKMISKNNKFIYRQYSSDRSKEYISMNTLSDCTSFRYFYDDNKATATMTKGSVIYIFKRGSNEMYKQSTSNDPEILTEKIVYSGQIYIAEDDAQNYFNCLAEYLFNTQYAVCLTGSKQSKVDEYTQALQEFYNNN